MIGLTILFLVIVVKVQSARAEQDLANIRFWNNTPHKVVVRCLGKGSAKHMCEVEPMETSPSDNNFLPGMRVVAVWLEDGSDAGSHVFRAQPDVSTTVKIEIVNGRLRVSTGYSG